MSEQELHEWMTAVSEEKLWRVRAKRPADKAFAHALELALNGPAMSRAVLAIALEVILEVTLARKEGQS